MLRCVTNALLEETVTEALTQRVNEAKAARAAADGAAAADAAADSPVATNGHSAVGGAVDAEAEAPLPGLALYDSDGSEASANSSAKFADAPAPPLPAGFEVPTWAAAELPPSLPRVSLRVTRGREVLANIPLSGVVAIVGRDSQHCVVYQARLTFSRFLPWRRRWRGPTSRLTGLLS